MTGIEVCPDPRAWHEAYIWLRALSEHRILSAPPKSLILAGWAFSSDVDKQGAWHAMRTWARTHGVEEEVLAITAGRMHTVAALRSGRPYDGFKFGGPVPRVALKGEIRAHALEKLKSDWQIIVGEELFRRTLPFRITGARGHRLIVRPRDFNGTLWSDWSRGLDIARCAGSFTAFRAAINSLLTPLVIDHVDFTPGPMPRDKSK